jgi:hypothetical protein
MSSNSGVRIPSPSNANQSADSSSARAPSLAEWEREDVALVIACDGLFDVLDDQMVAEVACPWMCRNDAGLFNDPVFDGIFDEENVAVVSRNSETNSVLSTSPLIDLKSVEVTSNLTAVSAINKNKSFSNLNGSRSKCDTSDENCLSEIAKSKRNYGCKCELITRGHLAELAALRLRSAADALETLDNVSIIVVFL